VSCLQLSGCRSVGWGVGGIEAEAVMLNQPVGVSHMLVLAMVVDDCSCGCGCGCVGIDVDIDVHSNAGVDTKRLFV